ncbi:hypothetical protein GCM10008090_01050 [Arenicella chitinivorans]|uniref:Ankyrin repeat domain-containing protein n=1 Tax=Arenicella chitinivorans TaxID=1329800 RepID=A0A918RF73_9GAMM|nr:hypothetical protein [Arenicella chitinivorans]GGZ96602.1 hypothetical protein GCM10008090_01050 [Arenicella chitinivorans]
MTRQELLDTLIDLEFFAEKKEEVFSYLEVYLHLKDVEMIKSLLKAGASPQAKDELSDYLHYLLSEYRSSKTLHGQNILIITEALLRAGANPNGIWCNNWRAYDYAVEYEITEMKELLEKYGANTKIREFI